MDVRKGVEMNVIIVEPSLTYRGTSHYARNLQSLLVSEGYTCTILRPRIRSRIYAVAWELVGLYLLRIDTSDVLVHVSGRVGLGPALFHSANVMVVHDLMRVASKAVESLWCRADRTSRLKCLYQTYLFRLGIHRSIKLVCNSYYVRSELRKFVTSRCVHVLYPPPSFSRIELVSTEAQKYFSFEHSSTKKARALWISGNTPNKNFQAGISWIMRSRVSLEIDILGISTKSAKGIPVSKQSKSMQTASVTRLSYMDSGDLIDRYLDYDFCMCLSNDEGFGIPFLDALMFGIPVIATELPTYREIYRLVENGVINYSGSPLWVDLDYSDLSAKVREAYKVKTTRSQRRSLYLRNLEAYNEYCSNQFRVIGDWF